MISKIMCGDLTEGALSELMGSEQADLIYSDPPWNNSWVKIFKKQAGIYLKHQDIETFLKIYIGELKKYAKGIIYIEFGKNIGLLVRLLKEQGATQLNLWELPLGKTGKQYIWRGYFRKGAYKQLSVLPAKDICNWLVSQDKTEGGILLDPCIGLGRSYNLARKVNMNCYGLEINPAKVVKLMTKIEKKTPSFPVENENL